MLKQCQHHYVLIWYLDHIRNNKNIYPAITTYDGWLYVCCVRNISVNVLNLNTSALSRRFILRVIEVCDCAKVEKINKETIE